MNISPIISPIAINYGAKAITKSDAAAPEKEAPKNNQPQQNSSIDSAVDLSKKPSAIVSVDFVSKNEAIAKRNVSDSFPEVEQSIFAENQTFFSDLSKAHSFYTNGIQTKEKDARSDAEVLTRSIASQLLLSGKLENIASDNSYKGEYNVEMHYNPTSESKLGVIFDTVEANANLLGVETEIASDLAEKVKAKVDRGQPVYLFGHSQGGAISQDAMRQVERAYQSEGLPQSEVDAKMSTIKFVGFGAFVHPNRFPQSSEILLVNNPNDNVPKMAKAIGSMPSMPKNIREIPAKAGEAKKAFGTVLGSMGNMITGNVKQAFSYGTKLSLNQLKEKGPQPRHLIPVLGSISTGKDFFSNVKTGFGLAISDHSSVNHDVSVSSANGGNNGYIGNMIYSNAPDEVELYIRDLDSKGQ